MWRGYVLNTISLTLGLPRVKVEKMVFLVRMKHWDLGRQWIRTKECDIMSGNCAFWENQGRKPRTRLMSFVVTHHIFALQRSRAEIICRTHDHVRGAHRSSWISLLQSVHYT